MRSHQGARNKRGKGNDGSDFCAEANRAGKSTAQAALDLANRTKGTDSDSSDGAEQTAAQQSAGDGKSSAAEPTAEQVELLAQHIEEERRRKIQAVKEVLADQDKAVVRHLVSMDAAQKAGYSQMKADCKQKFMKQLNARRPDGDGGFKATSKVFSQDHFDNLVQRVRMSSRMP